MTRRSPPNPSGVSYEQWASAMYMYLRGLSEVRQSVEPLPVLLAHRTANVVARASQAGILLYDPVYETPVVSQNGEWSPTRGVPLFSLNYDTAYNVDGAAVGTGGVKIPFNTQELDNAPWATFNPTTNDFTLARGEYHIEGFLTLTKVSGGAKSFTGFLATSAALTTPVGSVRMGSVHMTASAANDTTFIVPFRGQVSVPEGGDTYAVVVRTPATNASFGKAHSISGYTNVYARLTIQLIGLNE